MGGWEAPRLSEEQRRRLVMHRRRRSFSHFDLDIEEDEDGGGEDGRRHHQQRIEEDEEEEEEEEGEEEEEEEPRPRIPPCQHRAVDAGCKSVGVGFGRRSSFYYYRLPEQQLQLTIIKLDGSSFDVKVARSASVSELKLAVEELFTRSPKVQGNISWSHVWGHFCLCYHGHKLMDGKTPLRTLGIKDGDELHFIRHLSINYNPVKQQDQMRLWTAADRFDRARSQHQGSETGNDEVGSGYHNNSSFLLDETCEDNEQGDFVAHSAEFKLASCLRGWLSCFGSWCGRGRRRRGLGSSLRTWQSLPRSWEKLEKMDVSSM